ncbi:MAG: aspartate/glutamate racemase family protein [Rhizobiaceae bacterium]|nr:aspartate/glutamate racemase family protein [Rhizobiaceae bacterium]
MTNFSYTSIPEKERRPTIGLIVLQSDETVENEINRWLPPDQFDVLVSRVPSGEEVTEETLGAMAGHITQSASLFPRSSRFEAVAYCCTSGTSVIGAEKVAELVKAGCDTKRVINPLTALVEACEKRNIKRLAFLSPYIETVSNHLRDVVREHGIESPVFGTFSEGEEAKVAWIDQASIRSAAKQLAEQGTVDGIFLSCTNLKTFGLIEELEEDLGLPVLSSNYVLAESLKN